MKTKRLITHSDSFHADDVLAYSILRTLYPDARLVRTRSQNILSNTTPEDIVFDVGFAFCPARRLYDHHQPTRPLRDGGIPYSSVGLVWAYHGMDFLHSLFPQEREDTLAEVWRVVDERFVREIDKADNGYVDPDAPSATSSAVHLTMLIEDFTPNWDDRVFDYDARFLEAADAFSEVFRRYVTKETSRRRAHDAVLDAFLSAPDPRVVEIPDFMPVGSVVYDHGFDEALFLVERSRNGSWYLVCVRPEPDSFAQRKPLPREWAGLAGSDLSEAAGVPDAIFCHVQRFVCAAASRDSILKMARYALDFEPSEEAVSTPRP